jgi:hypothetical protein
MIEKITAFLTHAVTIYTLFVGIIGAIITAYITYQNFITAIEHNQSEIEVTQMMILKPMVREAENNPCPVSDAEWEEYEMNYNTLYDLRIKHGELHKNAPWKPIERVIKGGTECQK